MNHIKYDFLELRIKIWFWSNMLAWLDGARSAIDRLQGMVMSQIIDSLGIAIMAEWIKDEVTQK